MEFAILGPLEITERGASIELHSQKQRALLAFLLLHAGEWLSTDSLIEALWGERSPPTARAALHNHIARLRRVLRPSLIVSREGGYALEITPEHFDLSRFEELVAEARDEQGDERLRQLQEALALWRGPPLADLLFEPFAAEEAARLEELHVAALEELVDAELAAGGGPDLVERLEALVTEHPYRERLRAQLMLALYRDGRQVEALECYRQARQTLVEKLGIEPGSALRELEQAILRQDPSLEPPVPELAAAVPLTERRKTVTVLFAELGFPAVHDPELLRSASARALARVRKVLAAHGGTIEQRASDELLAVFGLPRAHEDDARRAARAAIELQAEAGEVELRLALESGEVLAGVDEAGHGFVSGTVVPLARHLLEHARPGETLVSEAALALLRGAALTTPTSDGARRLVRLEEELTASATTPLADRIEELAQLTAHFADVTVERRCRLVLLLGEAGIGKTRLAEELVRELEGEATIVRGRCLSYGQALSYWPLVEALRGLGEPAAQALERLVEGGATSPQQLAWSVQQGLVQAAQERPLLLLLEDLHWAETALLDLVEEVAGFPSDVPILLLGLARAELLEQRPDWAQQESLRLGPLPRPACEALLQALPDPPGSEQRAVLARAAGNPLFLEELSAFLAQGGGEGDLPPRLQVLLQARIDLLPEPERLLLSCAALEGTVFHGGALQALLPEDCEIADRLARLGETLLIRPTRSEVEGEQGYRFRHQLIRDTAYHGLPKAERARLHERFAEWLGGHSAKAGDLDDIAAYHLEQAALGRRELDEAIPTLEQRAATALANAANRARLRTDAHAAADLWRRALTLLDADDPCVPELEVELATGLVPLGSYGEAQELLADAERRAIDPCLAAAIRLARLGTQLHGDPEGVPAMIRRECSDAIPLFRRHEKPRWLARAWYLLAWAEVVELQIEAAAEAFTNAAATAHDAADRQIETDALGFRLYVLARSRLPYATAARGLEELAARSPGEPEIHQWLRFVRMYEAFNDGRCEEARRFARECSAGMRRFGILAAATVTMELGFLEFLGGDVQEADRLLVEGIHELQQHGERGWLSGGLAMLAQVRVAQGRSEEALQLVDEAMSRAGPEDRDAAILGLRARASALLGLNEIDEARTVAAAAVALASRTDSHAHRADAAYTLAEVLAADEGGATALAAAREAEQLYERLQRKLERQRAAALAEEIQRATTAGSAPTAAA